MSDDVPYEEKRKACGKYKYDNDPDFYYTEDGSFVVYEQFEDGEWLPTGKIEPTREQVEGWWARRHNAHSGLS